MTDSIDLPKRIFTCFAMLLFASTAAAQQSGDAIVSSDAQALIAINLTTGAQTTLPATPSDLLGIMSLAEESDGNLVFTRNPGGVARITLPGGAVSGVAGSPDLFLPLGIDVGPAGEILVSDAALFTNAAAAIDPVTGSVTGAVTMVPNAFGESSFDVAVDSNNDLFITYNSVTFLSPPGQFSLVVKVLENSTTPIILVTSDGGVANGREFLHLAADKMGTDLVVSTDTNELFLIDAATGVVSFLASGGSLTDIQGVTFDGDGDVLAIDATNGIVRVVTPSGAQSAVPGSAVFNPRGIIVYAPEPGFLIGAVCSGILLLALAQRRTGGQRIFRMTGIGGVA